MTFPAHAADARARQGFLATLAAVASIKLVGLVLDGSLRFFLGDSGSYLHTALTGWIPPDRSFLYGWLIAAVALPTQSAFALVAVQTLFGVASAMLLYAFLVFGLRVRAAWGAAAAVLLAVEPAQWFYERMMMAESAGLLAFLLFFGALARYVATGRWRWIAAFAALGVLAVALRISLLAVVLPLCALAPAVRALFANAADRGRPLVAVLRFAVHAALALGLTAWAHGEYKAWYGRLAGAPPGYTAHAGIFRLGLVAPLVRAEHFRDTGVSPSVLEEVTLPLADRRMREAQVWMPGGLVDVVTRHTDDPERVARKLSIRAAKSDPFALLTMGVATVSDYFVDEIATYRVHNDAGDIALEPDMLDKLRDRLHYDARGLERADTLSARWFLRGAPWLLACLLALGPLALLALVAGWHLPARGLRVLLALASLGLVAAHVLFSAIVSYRYLHPFPWFVLANGAVLWQALALRRRN